MAEAVKAIIGEKVLSKDGEVDVATLCGPGKVIGLYFSGHWCAPCHIFTETLEQFYRKIHKEKNLEIVFVSRDTDDKEFDEYFKTMPWLAMPYEDTYQSRDRINVDLEVLLIPSLIFVDGETGKVVNLDGRREVETDISGKNFPSWKC